MMHRINMAENADYDTRCKEIQKWLKMFYFVASSPSLAKALHPLITWIIGMK